MSERAEVRVPDMGDFDRVDVIEVLVSEGDEVTEEQSLITLESDKASLELPSPRAGTVAEVAVSVGDQVSEGDLVVVLEAEAGEADEARGAAPDAAAAGEPATGAD
ncbi:MAG: biotin/lipoyl-containing protein, partial [Acidobacteriota bacterium]